MLFTIRNFRNFFNLLCFLSILVSCQQSEQKPHIRKGTVIISGVVEGHESHSGVISLILENELYEQFNSIVLDQNGYFSFELEILHPQDVQLKYENGWVQIFIRQGDSLYFTLDADRFINEQFPEFELNGFNAETTRQIWQYRQYRKLEKFTPEPSNQSVSEYLGRLEEQLKLEDSVLTSFTSEFQPDKDFIVWAKAFFRFDYANYLINYSRAHPKMDFNEYVQLFDKHLFPINNAQVIISSNFSLHLRHYFRYNFLKDTAIIRLSKTGRQADAYELALTKCLTAVDKGLNRDIMLFSTLKKLSDHDYETFCNLLPIYISNIENHYLEEMLLALTTKDVINITLYSADDLWKLILEEQKNKIIYVSLWATWCGPCKNEIPFLKSVEQEYRDKDISFVNICMSSNQNVWEKLIKDIPGEHFILSEEQGELFRSQFNIKGYPTYMLIDKSGKIKHGFAPRPSQIEDLKSLLSELLES